MKTENVDLDLSYKIVWQFLLQNPLRVSARATLPSVLISENLFRGYIFSSVGDER